VVDVGSTGNTIHSRQEKEGKKEAPLEGAEGAVGRSSLRGGVVVFSVAVSDPVDGWRGTRFVIVVDSIMSSRLDQNRIMMA